MAPLMERLMAQAEKDFSIAIFAPLGIQYSYAVKEKILNAIRDAAQAVAAELTLERQKEEPSRYSEQHEAYAIQEREEGAVDGWNDAADALERLKKDGGLLCDAPATDT